MGGWLAVYWPSALLVGLYAGLVIRNAVIGHRQTKTELDFYVGGRSLGGVALGFSFFATFASTNSYVGFAGEAYFAGPVWLLIPLIFFGLTWISWRWVAPRLRTQTEALGSLTIPDFIGLRFESTKLRVLAALVVIGASVLYLTAIFRGIGLTVDAFWHTGYDSAIIVVLAMVVLYTAAGGFHSVVRTDILQGSIMILAAGLLFWGAMSAAGGPHVLAGLFDAPAEPAFTAAAPPLPVLLGTMFAVAIKIVVEPRLLSRFYGLKSPEAARAGMITSMLSVLFVFALLTPIGLLGRSLFPDGTMDPDLIVPTLIASEQWIHPAIAAFLFLALLAAAMSSIDSVLLVTATTFHRDILSFAWRSPDIARIMRHTRLLTVAFGVVTALVAIDPPGGIVSLTVFSGALYSACLMAPILFGLSSERADTRAAGASMVVGLVTLLTASVTPVADHVHPIFVATGLSILAYLAALALRRKRVEQAG